MDSTALLFWTSTVLIVVLAILTRHWRADLGAGLVFAYVATFAVLHWLAPALYLLPWYDKPTRDATILGLRESGIAIICFAIGSEIVIRMRRSEIGPLLAQPARVVDDRLINLFLVTGAFFYVVIFPIASRLPSVTAIAATGSALIVAGIGLKCWNAWTSGRYAHLWTWLGLTVAMPIVTVLVQGFLGYGFGALLTVLRVLRQFLPATLAGAGRRIAARVSRPVGVRHLHARPQRHPQRGLGGRRVRRADGTARDDACQQRVVRPRGDRASAAHRHAAEPGFHARRRGVLSRERRRRVRARRDLWCRRWPRSSRAPSGRTNPSSPAAVNWCPPTPASGSWKARASASARSWKRYVNFGRAGVIVVFLCIGALLTWADISAKARLVVGDGAGFVTWYLGGLGMLQLGGAFSEVTSTAAASILVALALGYFSRRIFPDRRNERRVPAVPADLPESISR